jgi:pyridoxine kinase
VNLLSIQSHVCYGHVGNSAAVFPLQRCGVEVWPVHTVQFSSNTAYPSWTGKTYDADLIRKVIKGIDGNNVLGECDAVLSGYLGSVEVGEAILEAVAIVKQDNPSARYCCDPVIGDIERGVYVKPDIAEFLRDRALPAADIVTPNQFELEHLSGRKSKTLDEVLAAVQVLRDLGPHTVMVTSLRIDDTPEDCLDLLGVDDHGACRVRTPLLPVSVNGAGDLTCALFLMHYLRTGLVGDAVANAASSVFGILSRTADEGSREMLLIAAQEELVKPSKVFKAEPIEIPLPAQRAL